MRLAKSTLWCIIALLRTPVVSSPDPGGLRHGPEHAKNVFHTTGFQTQNALYGDQNVLAAINLNWEDGSHDPVMFQPRFGTFEPLKHLELVSNDSFTHLAHPAFPLYSVRVKKSDLFCGEGIKCASFRLFTIAAGRSCKRRAVTRAYSGYIDTGARHLYFTFVESLNDPTNDPVVIWISGGPLVSCQSTRLLLTSEPYCDLRPALGPGGASENGLFNYRAVGAFRAMSVNLESSSDLSLL